MPRDFDALLLDLDGTLLDSSERISPANLQAVRAAEEAGVRVLVATGRSLSSARPVLDELGLSSRAVLFNGAAVWCPGEDRLVEERLLSNRTQERLETFGEECGDLVIWMTADRKVVRGDLPEESRRALMGLSGIEFVDPPVSRPDHVIRVTFLSGRLENSARLASEVEASLCSPAYLTHFPLSVLPLHRSSSLHAVDVHPPCRGKAEALRVLDEIYGIPASRTVAVGDATNDLPMVQAAGLGVAMESGMQELVDEADRVIGNHDTDAIAELVDELFLSPAATDA